MKKPQMFKKMKYDILTLGKDGSHKHTETTGAVHTVGIFAVRKTARGWIVDHLPSGRFAMIFKTKKHAVKFISLAMAPDVLPLFVLSDKEPDRIKQIYDEAVS